ncbi:MAG: hypothetical protein ACOYM3_04610 [Terrimicrobiaceae bacterium]
MSTTILQALFNSDGNPLNETVLLAEVRLMSGGGGEGQFRADLARLKSAGMISVEEDQITGDRMWKIEPKGSQRITGGR